MLNVTRNDVLGHRFWLASVTQPARGTVSVSGDQLLIDLPPGLAEPIDFTYTVTDGTFSETAQVVIPSGSVGAPVVVETDAQFMETPLEARAEPGQFAPSVSPPVLLLVVRDLELPLLTFTASSMALLAMAIPVLVRRRRRHFVAVDAVERGDTARANHRGEDGGSFQLRHNARYVWATGRRDRANRVQIETPNGRAWIPAGEVGTE